MAVTTFYDHTVSKFLDQTFSDADDYIVLLLNASGVAAFNAAHTTLSAVTNAGAYEIYGGTGWTQGGITIANTALTAYLTGDMILTGDDVAVPITVTALGPFSGYVVYNGTDANDPPLFMTELDAPQTISVNYMAVVEWPASGIVWFKRA